LVHRRQIYKKNELLLCDIFVKIFGIVLVYFILLKILKLNKMKRISVLFAAICLAGIGAVMAQDQPAKPVDIVFEKTIIDFGDIPYKSEAKAVFVFKNISAKPIALTNVKASCGCTTPEWSKEPIKKKKKGQIVVTYDTQRIGNFNKTISVFTDRQDNPVQLQIKGNVLPPAEGDPNYDEYQKKQSDKKQINKDPNGKQIQKADDKKLEEKPNK